MFGGRDPIGAASHLLYSCTWPRNNSQQLVWKVVECQRQDSPLPRWGHSSVAWGHQLWVLGGENSSVTYMGDMHRFDVATR